MISLLLRLFVKSALALRYRIRVKGLEAIGESSDRGILFLPNHPALIDPIVLMSVLQRRFHPTVLADEDQVDRFFVRWMAKQAGVLPIPNMAAAGPEGREAIEGALVLLAEYLSRGRNVLLYPAGHIYRKCQEDLGGNSAVESLMRAAPNTRVVLVRTRGLWGSNFSWASGRAPSVGGTLKKGLLSILASAIFFVPKREVTVELYEPEDFPRTADRTAINRFLENFYNEDAPKNTYVPHSIWERGQTRQMPEPHLRQVGEQVGDVPSATRQIVTDYLRELTGLKEFDDSDQLARDLGLDSLARSDLLVFLAREFGFPQSNVDALRTVGDVMLAACGEAVHFDSAGATLKPIPPKWFAGPAGSASESPASLLTAKSGTIPESIVEAFLIQARKSPDRVIIADQTSGVKTYRDIITAVMALRPELAKLAGQRVGIMLPASVAANIVYLATLAAGKTPVMVNWTVGLRNMTSSLDAVGVESVVTAEELVRRVSSQGVEFGQLADRFAYLEKVGAGLSMWKRICAWLKGRFNWSSLADAKVADTAVVLFTSGSETLPKAVPLTHTNVLTNLSDALSKFDLLPSDRVLGFLPPFHSFGLTVGTLVPLCLGIQMVYHSNPNESAVLGKLIEGYKVTILAGTPTFLNGILRSSTDKQLATLRLGITGAERCPPSVYAALGENCPKMVVVEGYGVTECSPIIAANDARAPRQGTIGKVLPSFEYAVVDAESDRRADSGAAGVLLVRGPCVFGGYISQDLEAVKSPFVEFEGEAWYRTGDLVKEDSEGVLTFCGRLKRFVKIGGEMISLPAIEAVLEPHYPRAEGEGPTIGVEVFQQDLTESAEPSRPTGVELVLFTTRPADRAAVNLQIREAGLSALHNIRRVVKIDEIPVLGTGKTDYRVLKAYCQEMQ